MKETLLRVLHVVIIVNFVLGMGYAMWMVMFVLTPEGSGGGPLWGRATEISMDLMARRRLYSLEFWIAFAGLTTYLAITVYLPRQLRAMFPRESTE